MWPFVLARRWWVGHLLVGMCCVVFLRLGRWQWDRAHSPTGDWQNLGYALQWPLFALALALAWARFLWLECHRLPQTDSSDPQTTVRSDPAAALSPPVRRPPVRRPPVPQRHPYPPTRQDDPDDELAAYNAYLARLAEQDRR